MEILPRDLMNDAALVDDRFNAAMEGMVIVWGPAVCKEVFCAVELCHRVYEFQEAEKRPARVPTPVSL